MTFIANILFLLFIIFCCFLALSSLYRDDTSPFEGDQSERQEKNEDYNKDYYP